MDQMELQEMTAMSITAVFMALTRFAPLKSRGEAILMVRFLFFAGGIFSQNLISSCEQSACPHEVDVPALFYPQRTGQAPNTRQNQY
jgi:hypothetical protein